MAKKLYCRLRIEVPRRVEVLWGPEEADGRHPVEDGDDILEGWKRQEKDENGKTLYTRKLQSGEWLHVIYTSTSNSLSPRDYKEIVDKKARLVAGVIGHTDDDLLEQD